jgi:hypothetical protein
MLFEVLAMKSLLTEMVLPRSTTLVVRRWLVLLGLLGRALACYGPTRSLQLTEMIVKVLGQWHHVTLSPGR